MGYREVILADRPLGYWRPGDATSATNSAPLRDQSGNGFDMTVASGAGVTGNLIGPAQIGRAVACSGASYYASYTDSTQVFAPGAWTIECWFRESAAASDQGLFCHPHQNATNTFWAIRLGTLSAGFAYIYTDFPSSGTHVGSLAGVCDGLWHQLVGTWDGTTLALYVDAVLQGSTALSGAVTPNTQPVVLGAYDTAGTSDTGAAIADCAFWNRALLADRIKAHYLAGKEFFYGEGGPLGYSATRRRRGR